MNEEKSRRIVMRLKIPMYEFLYKFAKMTNRTMTDVIKIAIEHYYYRLFLEKMNPTTKELKEEFFRKFGSNEKRKKILKKKIHLCDKYS